MSAELSAAIARVRKLTDTNDLRPATCRAIALVCAAAARAPAEGAGPVAWPPREPTPAMNDAGIDAEVAHTGRVSFKMGTAAAVWRAMWDAAPPAPSVAPAGREDALTYHGLWKMVNSGAVDGKGRDFYRVMHLTTKESVGKYLTKLQAELVEAAMNKAEVIDAAREGEKP